MRLKSAGKAKRHPLWSQEQFLADLAKYKAIKKVCEIYADEATGWRGYYADVWRWRKKDPEYDAKVAAILADEGTARPENGRPRNDAGDKSWQVTYCEALVKHRLALDKAAAETPYTVRQIQEFQDSACSSYDEPFTKMVEEAELIIASRAREVFAGLLDPEGYVDLDTAKITQTKGWVATKMLEKLEPKKFGRRQVEVTGTIDHRHQHRLMGKTERLLLLDDDRKMFEKRQKELVSGEREASNKSDDSVIDVEVVGEVQEV